jgi:hypothetical protein
MAKRKYWENLNDKQEFFAQMPYSILDSTLSNNAKVLFMHLWKDAYSNNRKFRGKHYSDMTRREMAEKLGYKPSSGGIRAAHKAIKDLNSAKVIHTTKSDLENRLRHYFLSKDCWF